MAEFKLSYTAKEIDEKLGKVDSLEVTSVSATSDSNGNVTLEVSEISSSQDRGAVRFDIEQSLTETQQAQARENIGAICADDVFVEVSKTTETANLFDKAWEYGFINAADGSDATEQVTHTIRSQNYIAVEGGRRLCYNRNTSNLPGIMSLYEYDGNKEFIKRTNPFTAEANKWTNNGVTLETNTEYVRLALYIGEQSANLEPGSINLFYYENRSDVWAGGGDVFLYVEPAITENFGKFIPEAKVASVLTGKKIVYEGDSIAESRTGATANNGGGYAKIIADMVGGKYVNKAVSGGILRTKTGIETNSSHSVVDSLVNLPTDGDLYCFEGGINDFWGNAVLGTYTPNDYTGELDATTICGALETIFRYALNTFAGKPICFVITHKIQGTAYGKNTAGNTFKEYRDAMVGICEKYSIPYYDAFSESGLNGWNEVQNNLYLTANINGTADGCHPNEEGYKRYYVPQLLDLFERIMPVG